MRKAGPPRDIPPPLELQCLKALWSLGEGSVRAVQQMLESERRLAYTTVMTIMDRLAKKGAVERRKSGRSFVYAPVLTREKLRRLAVRDLVDSLFGGSEEELAAYLNGRRANGGASSAPIEALDTALL
jgi:BlaI family penicillinase repressor